jgi:hypothetical protein
VIEFITSAAGDATLGEFFAWLAAVGAAVFGVWKAWPIFRRTVSGLSKAIKLADTLVTLPADIAFIRGQLDTNHGGSVKDATIRTEAAVAELTAKFSGLETTVASIDARTVAVEKQGRSLKASVYNTNRKLDARTKTTTTQPSS